MKRIHLLLLPLVLLIGYGFGYYNGSLKQSRVRLKYNVSNLAVINEYLTQNKSNELKKIFTSLYVIDLAALRKLEQQPCDFFMQSLDNEITPVNDIEFLKEYEKNLDEFSNGQKAYKTLCKKPAS